MKRLFYLILGLLTTTAGLLAQTAAPAPASAPTASDTTLLWEITGEGYEQPSYLFGTIHIIPAEDYYLAPTVVKALNDAEEIIFEIDTREMNDPMMMMSMMSKINMRGDTSLEDLLTEEQYEEVDKYFSAQGIPFMFLKKMKPLFLSAMVGQDMGDMMGGGGAMDGMKSYEMELTKLAESTEKEISGLETMEFQLSLFDSIPYRVQAQMLHQAVVSQGEDAGGEDQMAVMIDMYKRRAVAEMASMIGEESQGMANFEEMLLTRRNANWIPLIEGKLGDATRIFAVGAGHLGGELGLIALLRAAGLTVKPVY